MGLTKRQVKKLGRRLRKREADSYSCAITQYIQHSLDYLPILKSVSDVLWNNIQAEPSLTQRTVYIGSRLKQVRSVSAKLRRLQSGLDGMQDIAGCRVVVPDLWDQSVVLGLVRKIFKFSKTFDYRKDATQGYRGFHFVLEDLREKEERVDHWPPEARIELQVRTELQDLWANLSELYGKYSVNEEHAQSLLALSDTLWDFDQLRLAIRTSKEEHKLLELIDDKHSPIETVVNLHSLLQKYRSRQRDEDRIDIPQTSEHYDKIINNVNLIPLASALSRRDGGTKCINGEKMITWKEVLDKAALVLFRYLWAERSVSTVLNRKLRPNKQLRKHMRRICRESEWFVNKKELLQYSFRIFSVEPEWIDCLPVLKNTMANELSSRATPQESIPVAILEDGTCSMFGLVRSFAFFSGMRQPLEGLMLRLATLTANRLNEWCNHRYTWQSEEKNEWRAVDSHVKWLLVKHAGLCGNEDFREEIREIIENRDLRSRVNGIIGHVEGLYQLKEEMPKESEEERYSILGQWIDSRNSVGGDAGKGPRDLKNEIRRQRKNDQRFFGEILRSAFVREQFDKWGVDWEKLEFGRLMEGFGQTRLSGQRRDTAFKFCIIVKKDDDLFGKIEAVSEEGQEIGKALHECTTLERIQSGEAVLFYANLDEQKIDTHLRYFRNAQAMVERIMEESPGQAPGASSLRRRTT